MSDFRVGESLRSGVGIESIGSLDRHNEFSVISHLYHLPFHLSGGLIGVVGETKYKNI